MSEYIDSDTLDQCREAMRAGRTLEQLARQLRVAPEPLAKLLELPASKTEPQTDEFDLWSADRLNEVL